jgi:hypothetical protein
LAQPIWVALASAGNFDDLFRNDRKSTACPMDAIRAAQADSHFRRTAAVYLQRSGIFYYGYSIRVLVDPAVAPPS